MQFSNHPKEDSLEHVVISRERDAERNLGDCESGYAMSCVNNILKKTVRDVLFLCHVIGGKCTILSFSLHHSIKIPQTVHCLLSEIHCFFIFVFLLQERLQSKINTTQN